MYAVYVIASSLRVAYKNMFSGDYYDDLDTADRQLKEFGRNFQSVYEILLPMPNIVVESKNIQQLKKEKHNASQ